MLVGTLEKLQHTTQAAFVIPKPGMCSSFKTNMAKMPKPTLFSVLIYIVVKIEKVPTFSYKILNSYTKPHFLSFELVKSKAF